jgi:hypothetical protein
LLKTEVAFATDADPFTLVNHLPLLIPIDRVDALEFTFKGKRVALALERPVLQAGTAEGGGKAGDKVAYRLDGKAIDEPTFKNIYQWIIGIALEGWNPKVAVSGRRPEEATVTFHLNGGLPPRHYAFFPFDDDFYALSYEGEAEFLVTKAQVARVAGRIAETLGGRP